MEENTTEAKPTAISLGIKYGAFMAVTSIAIFMIQILLDINPFERGWKGLIGLFVAVAFVVLAQKEYKDKGDGFMSYGQGLGVAIVTMLVSILISALFTYIYSQFIDTNIMNAVYEQAEEDARGRGQDPEIAVEFTKKLFWVFYLVFGVFFGVLTGVIVTIFTQRKNAQSELM
jgi:Protein of unknown function (DUF4199)